MDASQRFDVYPEQNYNYFRNTFLTWIHPSTYGIMNYSSKNDSLFEQSRANRKINHSALGALFYEIILYIEEAESM